MLLVRGLLLPVLHLLPPFSGCQQAVCILQNVSSYYWCDTISLSLPLLLSWLCSVVPTCSRLMTFNHHPSQQGSSRASHCEALDSRSVSQAQFYKPLVFIFLGRTRLITFGGRYRGTPVSGIFGQEPAASGLGLSVL